MLIKNSFEVLHVHYYDLDNNALQSEWFQIFEKFNNTHNIIIKDGNGVICL